MTILGVAGTAKNTGKTTTLMEVTKYFSKVTSPSNILLTSIGYDGEDFDNITGLPKPRVEVPSGARVASALPLLKASDCAFQDLIDTGIRISLGRLFIATASKKGKVVLSGPTSTRDLRKLLKLCPEKTIVLLDGAFSRLSPMVMASHLILATGAARDKDSHRLAREMEAIARVLFLPSVQDKKEEYDLSAEGGLFLKGHGEELVWRLLNVEKEKKRPLKVYVPGIVSPGVFIEVLSQVSRENGSSYGIGDSRGVFVFSHPISMLLSGSIENWERALELSGQMGYGVKVERTCEFLGFTLNPYLPLLQPSGKFIATYVPPGAFLEDIRSLISSPCTDIVLEGTGKLYSMLSKIHL